MRTSGGLILATVLSLPVSSATTSESDIKNRKRETARQAGKNDEALSRLIKSGFLKLASKDNVDRDRMLNGRPPQTRREAPPSFPNPPQPRPTQTKSQQRQQRNPQHTARKQPKVEAQHTGRKQPKVEAQKKGREQPRVEALKTGRKQPKAEREKSVSEQPNPDAVDTGRHRYSDDWYDDYFTYYDDWYGGGKDQGKGDYYDDQYVDDYGHDDYYFVDDHYVDDHYGKGVYYDDYYHDDGKGSKKSKKSSKKGGEGKGKGKGKGEDKGNGKGKGKGQSGYDDYYTDDYHVDDFYLDDIFVGDDAIVGGGELLYTIGGFIDIRNLDAPTYANPSAPNDFAAGNIYTFVDTPLWELDGIGASALLGLVQGTCTRTDPNDELSAAYVGRGHCTLTIEALVGSEVVASFAAEGDVFNEEAGGLEVINLVIKGGIGLFAGISGEVLLYTSTLDTTFSPPQAIYDPSIDFLNDADGYEMLGFIYSDSRIGLLEDDAFVDGTNVDDTIVDDIIVDDIIVDDVIVDDLNVDDLYVDDLYVDDLYVDDLYVDDVVDLSGDDLIVDDLIVDDLYVDDLYVDDTNVDDLYVDDAGQEVIDTETQGMVGNDETQEIGDDETQEIVTCPDQPEEEFCDCSIDCVEFADTRCSCEEAQLCCGTDST